MPVLHVAEFEKLGKGSRGEMIPICEMPPIAEQAITYTTNVVSAAFNESTRFIRVKPLGGVAHIAVGASPAATASSTPLSDGETEYFSVINGDKIAAYDGSS